MSNFIKFSIEHDLKRMSRYCEHDERYEMQFEKKDGQVIEFVSSRQDVAKKYGYAEKDKSVRQFEQMAMDWYTENHSGQKNMQEKTENVL